MAVAFQSSIRKSILTCLLLSIGCGSGSVETLDQSEDDKQDAISKLTVVQHGSIKSTLDNETRIDGSIKAKTADEYTYTGDKWTILGIQILNGDFTPVITV